MLPGTFLPSPLLTGAEAARWLRLAEDDATPDQMASAQRTLQRLVQDKLLRPVQPSKSYLYSIDELQAYVRRATTRWPEIVQEREQRKAAKS